MIGALEDLSPALWNTGSPACAGDDPIGGTHKVPILQRYRFSRLFFRNDVQLHGVESIWDLQNVRTSCRFDSASSGPRRGDSPAQDGIDARRLQHSGVESR